MTAVDGCRSMKELLKGMAVVVDVYLDFWFSCVMSVFRLLCKSAVNSCRALWSNRSTSSLERKRPCEPSVSSVSSFLNKSGQHNLLETPFPAKL